MAEWYVCTWPAWHQEQEVESLYPQVQHESKNNLEVGRGYIYSQTLLHVILSTTMSYLQKANFMLLTHSGYHAKKKA